MLSWIPLNYTLHKGERYFEISFEVGMFSQGKQMKDLFVLSMEQSSFQKVIHKHKRSHCFKVSYFEKLRFQ